MVGEVMNFMCHVSECDFEGAKTLKLSEKTEVLADFCNFLGKKTQKFGSGGLFILFEIHKYAGDRLKIQKLICSLA